jgi:hypothetical protein
MQIEREHREAMFAWGVRSDYFLWVRTHPGEKPTWTHFLAWRLIDELERAS